MSSCKFCGVAEGAHDRNGKLAHINRDKLCAPCYYVLERVKRQPEKLSADTLDWFVAMCEFNIKHGMFVPVAQRRRLQHLKPKQAWRCKRCGEANDAMRDGAYVNYCQTCAYTIRVERDMPVFRHRRNDNGALKYKV